MKRQRFAPLCMVAALFWMSGCASTVKTTLPSEWSVDASEAQTLYIEPQEEDVLLAYDKNVTILDGQDGAVVYGEEEDFSLGGFLMENTRVAGVSLGSMNADAYRYAYLNDAGIVLIFDYSISDDIIRAIDLETGEELWRTEDYRWSLEKYQAVGGQVVLGIAQSMGFGAAMGASAVGSQFLRHRYVQALTAPVPSLHAVLLKTVGALKLLDTRTGEEIWSISDVDGSGLQLVRYLPETDELLIATNFTSLLEWASGGMELLRLDAQTGEKVWSENYGAGMGSRVRAVWRNNDNIFVEFFGGALEVYDFKTGERILQTRDDGQTALTGISRGSLIATPLTARPIVQDGIIYTAHTSDFKAFGSPDKGLRKFDLSTGEMVWTSELIERMHDVRDLTAVNNQLVVARVTHWGGGALGSDPKQHVVAWDTETGDIVWNRELGFSAMDGMLLRGDEEGHIRLTNVALPPAVNLNMVREGDLLFTAGETTLYALDATTGETVRQVDFSSGETTLGQAVMLLDQGEEIALLQETGISYFTKDDLALQKTVAFEDEIEDFMLAGGYLFAVAGGGLRVVNLERAALVGVVGMEIDPYDPFGNLYNNYYVTAQGQSVYVFGDDHILTKYRVHP